MFDVFLKKLRQLDKTKKVVLLCAGAVIIGLFMGVVTLDNNGHDVSEAAANTTSAKHSATDKTTHAGIVAGATVASSNTNKSTTATTPDKPTTVVVKTTTNSDGTTTKEIVNTLPVAFSTQSQNDVNLKRGTTQVQAGQNGTETIVYSVIYDKNGKEISRKTISDTITKAAVSQITKVGVSDYNLNADTWDGTEFGEMCLPADYNPSADGCIGTASGQHFAAVAINGINYVYCVSSASGVCAQDAITNIQPIIAIQGNTFSYQGATYRADPRAGGGGTQLLTLGICSQYGLACGSW